MVVLSCTDIKKYFGTDCVLEQISFSVNQGEKIGLIGKNGAGKSTLFRILTGELEYDEGHLYQHKDVSLGYLTQHINYTETTTLYEFCLEVFSDVIELEAQLRHYEQEIANHAESDKLEKIMNTYAELTDEFNNINAVCSGSKKA